MANQAIKTHISSKGEWKDSDFSARAWTSGDNRAKKWTYWWMSIIADKVSAAEY